MDVKKMLKGLLIFMLLFIVVFAVLRYGLRIDFERGKSVLKRKDSGPEYVDRGYIVEKSEEALEIRMAMLDSAEERVDIAYYKIDTGHTSQIFVSKLLETADRGIKVRIYLDGVLNSLKGEVKNANYAFADHPNIEYRWHEPLNVLRPWTFNNRLHDKIIMVDGKLALIGGRNIGDRFFVSDTEDRSSVFDRDVLVYNEDLSPDSVIRDMEAYYNSLWEADFSADAFENLSEARREKGRDFKKRVYENVARMKDEKGYDFPMIDWEKKTSPVKRVEFVHNDIYDWKNPIGLQGILELSEAAEDEIIAQSPYIIISKNMRRVFRQYDLDYGKMKVLTNSYYSTPNVMAISGYHNVRKEIVDDSREVYEYHAGNSIHGKSYVFDEEVAIIGSFNLDPRSSYLSSEAYLVFYDEDMARNLKSNMEDLKDSSLLVNKDYEYEPEFEGRKEPAYRLKLFLIKILSKVVYFFDYML